jgi:hypothetical protein
VDKTFAAIEKLKEVELELLRLKTALEMMNRAYDTKKEWVRLTDEELEFYTEELGQGELGRGVLRAVVDFLKEKNT